jgi:hypothetical protein
MKAPSLKPLPYCLIVLAAAQTYASNTPLAPFTGTMTETWESFPEYTWNNSPLGPTLGSGTSIMAGCASITGPAFMAIIRPAQFGSTWGLGSSGYAQVSDGVKALGVDNYPEYPPSISTAIITWSTPISQFGGYFAAPTEPPYIYPLIISDPAIITLRFFTPAGVLLSEESISYSHSPPYYGPSEGDGGLDWHGWQFSDPVGSVSITGCEVVMDGLQASVVPEPRSLALFGLGFAALTLYRHPRRRDQKPPGGAESRCFQAVSPQPWKCSSPCERSDPNRIRQPMI